VHQLVKCVAERCQWRFPRVDCWRAPERNQPGAL